MTPFLRGENDYWTESALCSATFAMGSEALL
jgi:hypothetical protein